MKAMVLAAGLGTRLRPLTNDRPKALVEVAGRTLLEITLPRLRGFDIREVIINVHHFADMVLEYLKAHENFGMRIEVSREDVLLDTGGGLKKAGHFFLEDSAHPDEPFILHNVDVISTIDLRRMVQFHTESQALATLAVQDRKTSRYLLFDEQLQLCGRRAGPRWQTRIGSAISDRRSPGVCRHPCNFAAPHSKAGRGWSFFCHQFVSASGGPRRERSSGFGLTNITGVTWEGRKI